MIFDDVVVNWPLFIDSWKYPCNWTDFTILGMSANDRLDINRTDQTDWLLMKGIAKKGYEIHILDRGRF